jgi:Glutamate/Leucine/Phenylalanine/Valine dehydrogenase
MIVHARARGAETWWKSFTTGKSAEHLGGVPHDIYGMTSLSVRQYVVGIYKQLGLQEKNITKVQTGGPGTSSSPFGFDIRPHYGIVQQTVISVPVSCHFFVLKLYSNNLLQTKFFLARTRLLLSLMVLACWLILSDSTERNLFV